MSTSNFFLEKIKYDEHGWNICADLKVVAILMGLQRGWAKYDCFKCLWDTLYSGDQETSLVLSYLKSQTFCL